MGNLHELLNLDKWIYKRVNWSRDREVQVSKKTSLEKCEMSVKSVIEGVGIRGIQGGGDRCVKEGWGGIEAKGQNREG